jgi:hypothetical protein
MLADPVAAVEPLLDRHVRLGPHRARHLDGLVHHRRDEISRGLIAADPGDRGAGQRAERVERDVAHELHPDLVAEPCRLDRALQATGDHRVAEQSAALRS